MNSFDTTFYLMLIGVILLIGAGFVTLFKTDFGKKIKLLIISICEGAALIILIFIILPRVFIMPKDFFNHNEDAIQKEAELTTYTYGKEKTVSSEETSMSTDHQSQSDDQNQPDDTLQRYLNNLRTFDTDCYSPVSLNTALSIYSKLIKDGTAKDEIQNFIGSKDYLNYKDAEKGVYALINRIWANSNKNLNFDGTGVEDIVFAINMTDSAKATKEKDAYVAEKTNDFITSTPTSLNNNVTIDVMNVLYFKDVWSLDLSLSDKTYEFNNFDGTTVNIPMIKAGAGGYYENDTCYAVPLKYENTGAIFYAIYPKDTIDEVKINELTSDKYLVDRTAYIYFPEFDAEVNIKVSGYKDKLGIGNISTAEPLFTGTPVCNAEISQVAKIKVDHEGTEAAAVTEITASLTCAADTNPSEPITIIYDKPFYYMIEDLNGDIAFIGVVKNIK